MTHLLHQGHTCYHLRSTYSSVQVYGVHHHLNKYIEKEPGAQRMLLAQQLEKVKLIVLEYSQRYSALTTIGNFRLLISRTIG